MIKFYGDITTVSGKSIIIHGVNCQNVMGSGVAKAIYTKWPEVKVQYHDACLEPGRFRPLLGTSRCVQSYDPLVIFNLYSQDKYGYDGKVYASTTAIFDGLSGIFSCVRHNFLGYKDIYMPEIGCGLGGLNFA